MGDPNRILLFLGILYLTQGDGERHREHPESPAEVTLDDRDNGVFLVQTDIVRGSSPISSHTPLRDGDALVAMQLKGRKRQRRHPDDASDFVNEQNDLAGQDPMDPHPTRRRRTTTTTTTTTTSKSKRSTTTSTTTATMTKTRRTTTTRRTSTTTLSTTTTVLTAQVETDEDATVVLRSCVYPQDVVDTMAKVTSDVLAGLPPWSPREEVTHNSSDITLAFLVQVSYGEQLPLIKRVFDLIYSESDVFLYLVDKKMLRTGKVFETLPQPLPANVRIESSDHADFFVWPRVEVVLQGFKNLMQQKWDFVIHLSESDYPLHSMHWIRAALAGRRQTNFMRLEPRCRRLGSTVTVSQWYWWSQNNAVCSCGSAAEPVQVEEVQFPMSALESGGVRLAHGEEWLILTRELVSYALSDELHSYRTLVSMHAAADEMFWQTLVLNIPQFGQTVSQMAWFLRWGHGKSDHSPDTLTALSDWDLQSAMRGHLFVRKVHPTESLPLLNAIDFATSFELAADASAAALGSDAWDTDSVTCTAGPELPAPSAEEEQEIWTGKKKIRQVPLLQAAAELMFKESAAGAV